MSERLNGFQQMGANADAQIAAVQARDAAAMSAAHVEALAMNQQFDKVKTIEERRNSEEVRQMNEAADVAIFGSRGRTQGYVDAAGKPITEPILGKVGELRDEAGVEDRLHNPRYGTKLADRQAAAAAHKAEGETKAQGYVDNIEALQAEGFELSQAKLIMDLREERTAKEQSLWKKLINANTDPAASPVEIVAKARQRIANLRLTQGNDEILIKHIIRNEGLFDRKEYDKFRFKRSNPKNGERKEFVAYRDQYISARKAFDDAAARGEIKAERHRRTLAREQVAEAEKQGRPTRHPTVPMPIVPTRRSLRDRARQMMANAYFAALNPREYFSDNDKGTRRKVVAGVIGAVAATGIAYLELKGGGVSQHAPKGNAHGAHEAVVTHHKGGAGHGVHHGAHEVKQEGPALTLDAQHSTIEDQVAHSLHTNVADPNVSKVTEAILHNQGLSWDDARHLPVGYSFHMPPHQVVEELIKSGRAG